MPELLGQHEDILMDLELLKRYSQEKEVLSDSQKDALNRLPKAKREARKEEILKEQERAKKERLRIRTLELEDKVKRSDLPADISNEILDMLSYAKERNMTFIYSVEKKIEALEVKVREAEIKKAQENEKQMKVLQNAAMVGTAVVAGMALAPYIQVQFNKEEFEKKSEEFYTEKILPQLVNAVTKPVKPLEIKRTYPKKRGSMYSKAHYKLAKKHNDELMDILVRDAQKSGSKQTPAEIKAAFENMPEVKKRATIRSIRKKYPEFAARQDREKKLEEKMTIDRGIVRLRRKKMLKEAGRTKSEPSRQVGQTLKKDRIQTKGPRIAERATNEKPAVVKEVSPAAKQAQMAPTAVKDKKKGISARLMKVEQLANKREDLKGISAALAASEQNKIQEAAERVRAESQKKFNPDDRVLKPLTPEQKDRLATLVKDKQTTSRNFWRKDESVNGVEEIIRGKDTKSREYWQNMAKRRYKEAG